MGSTSSFDLDEGAFILLYPYGRIRLRFVIGSTSSFDLDEGALILLYPYGRIRLKLIALLKV